MGDQAIAWLGGVKQTALRPRNRVSTSLVAVKVAVCMQRRRQPCPIRGRASERRRYDAVEQDVTCISTVSARQMVSHPS